MTWMRYLRYNDKVPRWMCNLGDKLDGWYYDIRNRFFAKYYRIEVKGMPKTAWWDTDTKMFTVIWQLFEEFVEGELACLSYVCMEDNDPLKIAYKNASRRDKRKNKVEWARKLVMKHWEWETRLTDESSDGMEKAMAYQAEKAKKIRELYLWWKDVRPNRPDPSEGLQWDALKPGAEVSDAEGRLNLKSNWTGEQFEASWKVEEQYEDEDTKMTQELIAIRHGLWT